MTERDRLRRSKLDSSKMVTARSNLIDRDDEMALLKRMLEDAVKGEGGLALIEGEAGVGKTRLVTELQALALEKGIEMLVGNCIEGGTPYLPFINALSGVVDRAITEHVTGIKEAYIIHIDGRLIVHSHTEDVSSVDDDVISSTLTAIRDFISHSFRPTEEIKLKEVLFGRYKIVMEQGDLIYVATVADPAFAEGLHPQIRRVVEDFETEYRHCIEGWKGELTEELMGSEKLLVALMEGRYSRAEDGVGAGPGIGGPSANDRGRLFESISRMVTDVAEERTLLLFFDDLQWMDPSSMDLLYYMAHVSIEEPILIIGAYRPEDLVDNTTPDQTHDLIKTIRKLSRERLYTMVKLKRLDEDGTRRMVYSIFPSNEFTYGLPGRVFDESKGNPFFVEEILRELMETKVIHKDGESWTNSEIEEISLPGTIKDVVMRRLGRLGDKMTEVLQYAAIAGSEFNFEVLQNALGWGEADIIEALDDLVKLRVLKESLGEDRYTFDHEVVREVLYDNMSRLARRRGHKKIAKAIMDLHGEDLGPVCFELANHFANTKDREQTIRFNILAGQKALRSGAVANAVKFFEVTLANLEPDIGTSDEARRKQLDVLYDIGRCHSILGNRSLSLSFFGKAIEEAKALGDKGVEGWCHERAGDEYSLINEWEKAMEHYKMALGLFKDLGDQKGMAEANRGVGNLFWRQGEFELAIEHLKYSVQVFDEEGKEKAMGSTLVDIGNVLKAKGDLDLSLENYEEGLKILVKVGDGFELARAHNNLGAFHADHSKDNDKARHHYSECLRISRQNDDTRGTAYSLAGLGSIYLAQEDHDRAEDYFREAFKLFKKIDESYMIGGTHGHFGRLAQKRGEHEKALDHFDKALRIYRDKNLKYDIAHTLMRIGETYIELGRGDEAEKVLAQSLALAEEIGAMDQVKEILEFMTRMA